MRMASARRAGPVRLGDGDALVALGAALAVTLVLVAATTIATTRLGSTAAIAMPLGAIVCLFLAANPNLTLSLTLIGLYIGLLDGYLKLSTGSQLATAGRDVLLYSVVGGILVRLALDRQRLRAPKFFLHIVLLVVLVLVQAFNPDTPGLKAIVGGAKQHLEFVPLFFITYAVVRTERRLQQFLLLLVLIAAANAVVAVVQSQLTPDQLAGWGPGYAEKVLGTGDFEGAGRSFSDAAGNARVRPFGLGSDLGAGGVIGALTVGVGLALVASSRERRLRLVGIVGIVASFAGIASSQSRLSVLIGILAALVYGVLSASSRQSARTFVVLIVGAIVVYGAGTVFLDRQDSGTTERFSTITPGKLSETIQSDRGTSLARIPEYAQDYPLGVGLGRSGPASGFGGRVSGLDTENSFNLLILELGTVGMLVYLLLWLRVLRSGVRAIRRVENRRAQLYLAALVTGVSSILVAWFASAPTTTTPSSPYFWSVAGVIAWASVGGRSAFPDEESSREPALGTPPD